MKERKSEYEKQENLRKGKKIVGAIGGVIFIAEFASKHKGQIVKFSKTAGKVIAKEAVPLAKIVLNKFIR